MKAGRLPAFLAVAMLATTALVGAITLSSDAYGATIYQDGTEAVPFHGFDGSVQDLYDAAKPSPYNPSMYQVYFTVGCAVRIYDANGYFANVGAMADCWAGTGPKPFDQWTPQASYSGLSDDSVSWVTPGEITGSIPLGSPVPIIMVKTPDGTRLIQISSVYGGALVPGHASGSDIFVVPEGYPIHLTSGWATLSQFPSWITEEVNPSTLVTTYSGTAVPGTYNFVGTAKSGNTDFNHIIQVIGEIPYYPPENTTVIAGSNWSYQPTDLAGVGITVTGAPWLTVSGNTIYGTPTEAGIYNVTLTMSKTGYVTSNNSFTLKVSSELVVVLGPTNGTIIYEV